MKSIRTITPEEVKHKIEQQEDVYIVDVREHEEIAQGIIPGAKHIPMGEIPDRIHEIPKEREVIFVCRSGVRSEKVCEYLVHHGYDLVINMKGGMLEYTGSV